MEWCYNCCKNIARATCFCRNNQSDRPIQCLDSSMLSQPSLPYRLVESMNHPREPAHATSILPLSKKSATDKLCHPRASWAGSRSSRAESFSEGGRFLLFLLLEEDIARIQGRRWKGGGSAALMVFGPRARLLPRKTKCARRDIKELENTDSISPMQLLQYWENKFQALKKTASLSPRGVF